ncbi:MAG: MATE family efflux transporter [Bacteroidota bacterium]
MSLKRFFQDLLTAVKGTHHEYTTGSINRAIFMLAVPMILEMVMESLFAVVDAYWVGRVGTDAIATVGLTESVMMLVYAIAIGLSMATTAMVARRIGEKKPKAAADAGVQAIILALIISTIISVLGILYYKEVLELMGASASVIESGSGYTRIMLGGNYVIMLIFLLNAIFRGAGNAAISMRALWLANILNMVLDPLFIFGYGIFPEMGVEGAAIATNTGRGIGVAYQVIMLGRGSRQIKVLWENIQVKWEIIKRLVMVSLGGIGQYLIGSASWIFLVRIISEFGSEAVAGYTIAFRIIIFTILPSWGLANAAATLVGQNLGAQQPDRAEKSVWVTAFYNVIFLMLVSIIFYIWAETFVGIFSEDAMVISQGVLSLRIICLGYIFYAFGMVVTQSFNGAGDTKTPTWLNLLCYWFFQIPLAWVLSIFWEWGPSGAYIAIAVSNSVLAIISLFIFRRGKWKLVQV